jgi:AraC family transcriptional regulator of adaptative response/methylated-DNA-[protein]-cysteine methyltransferase
MLKESASILDTSLDVGLSGPGRLHDLFVTHEGMPPGAYKQKGEGLTIFYGFHPSPFGVALVMVTAFGLCGLAFADMGGEKAALADMTARWPNAQYTEDSAMTAPYAAQVFAGERWQANQPLRVTFIGTDFEIRVWETLLKIPVGKATTYGDIAASVGSPKAARAVGAAVGKNPISFVVPCHRVLGKSGDMTGYHWGLTRKRAILGWEAGQAAK